MYLLHLKGFMNNISNIIPLFFLPFKHTQMTAIFSNHFPTNSNYFDKFWICVIYYIYLCNIEYINVYIYRIYKCMNLYIF